MIQLNFVTIFLLSFKRGDGSTTHKGEGPNMQHPKQHRPRGERVEFNTTQKEEDIPQLYLNSPHFTVLEFGPV